MSALGCMKCGKKLGFAQTFCDECLAKMEQAPVKPNTVVVLPTRPTKPVTKKKPLHQRYFWDAEDKIDILRSKLRWVSFALVIAILGFLLAVAVIFMLLYWQGNLDVIPGFSVV